MRSAWSAVGAAFCVVGAALTGTVLARNGGASVLHVVLTPLVGWSFGLAGLLAWRREGRRRIGLLLLAVGFAWFVHLLDWTHVPALVAVGAPVRNAYAAVFAHLLLAFPDGRLGSRWARALVVAGYLDAVAVQSAATLLGGTGPAASWIRGDQPAAGVWYDVEAAAGVLLAALVLATLAARAARGRLPAGVWVAALVAFVALVGNLITTWLAPPDALWWWVVFSAALAAVPFAFLAGLLGVRLRRAGVAGLVVRLARAAAAEPAGPDGDAGGLRPALAEALHDPSLGLAFWVPGRQGYVDAQGHPVALPAAGGQRVATLVERDGRRIGALVHDVTVGNDPELVEAVAAAAGLALENARLQAELRARLAELAASRHRLVEATAAERRRIERNLHDGAQQRLLSVAFAVGLARSRLPGDPAAATAALAEAQAGLTQALDELRRLGQGIHPGVLVERGLRAAIAELVWTTPVPVDLDWDVPGPLPPAVEPAAYYVVAEAVANAVKHAEATKIRVRVARRDGRAVVVVSDDGRGGADPDGGTGLRGLGDRVEALDGRLTVHSPAGAGTEIRVELPCG